MRKLTLANGIEFRLSNEGVWSSEKLPLYAEELNKSNEVLRQGYSPSMGDPLNYILGQAAHSMGVQQIQFALSERSSSKQTDAVN